MQSYDIANMYNVRQAACFVREELDRNVSLSLFLRCIPFGVSLLDLSVENCGSFYIQCLINETYLASRPIFHIWDRRILDNSVYVVKFGRAE